MYRFAVDWGGGGKFRDTLGEADPGNIAGKKCDVRVEELSEVGMTVDYRQMQN